MEKAQVNKLISQGSILGPILFNIFLNDMFKFIKNADLVNYANDNTINHKIAIFRCLIVCHSQFCSIVWHFCGVGNTKKERGLRFVHGDYTSDYDPLLCKSKMPILKLGREAIQTYKIKNNLAPTYLKELITPIQNSKFHLPLFKSTRYGLNAFAYMALYGGNS